MRTSPSTEEAQQPGTTSRAGRPHCRMRRRRIRWLGSRDGLVAQQAVPPGSCGVNGARREHVHAASGRVGSGAIRGGGEGGHVHRSGCTYRLVLPAGAYTRSGELTGFRSGSITEVSLGPTSCDQSVDFSARPGAAHPLRSRPAGTGATPAGTAAADGRGVVERHQRPGVAGRTAPPSARTRFETRPCNRRRQPPLRSTPTRPPTSRGSSCPRGFSTEGRPRRWRSRATWPAWTAHDERPPRVDRRGVRSGDGRLRAAALGAGARGSAALAGMGARRTRRPGRRARMRTGRPRRLRHRPAAERGQKHYHVPVELLVRRSALDSAPYQLRPGSNAQQKPYTRQKLRHDARRPVRIPGLYKGRPPDNFTASYTVIAGVISSISTAPYPVRRCAPAISPRSERS